MCTFGCFADATEQERATQSLTPLSLYPALLVPPLSLVSICETCKSQLETGKQPPESCSVAVFLSMEQISLTLMTAFSFLRLHWPKRPSGNGNSSGVRVGGTMTQHFVVMHVYIDTRAMFRERNKSGNGYDARDTRPTCQCHLTEKGNNRQ